MRIYQKLTPLTPEEQQFAADHHWVIEWFFKVTNYDKREFYDVASLGYLKAVKSWLSRDELHQYEFSTIARQAMRGYIGCEQRKERRRIRALSLEAVISNSDGLALMDLITYDDYQNQYIG